MDRGRPGHAIRDRRDRDWLQWGHGISTVESAPGQVAVCLNILAQVASATFTCRHCLFFNDRAPSISITVRVCFRCFFLIACGECCRGFLHHQSARAAHRQNLHDASPTFFPFGFDAYGLNPLDRVALRRSQIDNEHLIFALIDDLRQGPFHSYQIDVREVTLKDGKLEMRPKAFHRLENAPQTFRIADVVGDQVVTTHILPCCEWRQLRNLS